VRLLFACALLVLLIAGGTAAGTLASHPAAHAATVTLNGSVGPGFTITLTNPATGAAVTSVPAGQYSIVVNDQSTFHNFHLMGPGVDQMTTVADTGTVTWNVTLQVGTYTFQCDPHQATLKGTFQVTPAAVTSTTTTTTTATTTTTTAKQAPGPGEVAGKVGPGFTIGLSAHGKRVTSLKAGRYALTVDDRSPMHNFVLEKTAGGHFERAVTTVSFVGKRTVTVNVTKGKWKVYCKPHESVMHASFTVS
jgi:plastocyanin